MTQAQRIAAAKEALASGQYMLRRSYSGRSNGGKFQWAAIGEWTEAPDWNTRRTCGGGLHGNHPTRGWAYCTDGADLDFCEIDEALGVIELGDKIKVRRARVLLRNDLSALAGLSVGGDLYLGNCTGLTCLPAGLSVGGYLDLGGCTGLTALPDNLSVGGDLDLGGCTGLTALPDNLSVGGSLDLGGCTGITALPAGLSVGGDMYLGNCTTALKDDATRRGLHWYD